MFPLAPFVAKHVRVARNRPQVDSPPDSSGSPTTNDNSSRAPLIANALLPASQTREHADRRETSADVSFSEATVQHQQKVQQDQRPSTLESIPLLDHSQLQYTKVVLGKGSFGVVRKASYGAYGDVAVKLLIHESDSALKSLKLEVEMGIQE